MRELFGKSGNRLQLAANICKGKKSDSKRALSNKIDNVLKLVKKTIS